MPRVSICSNLRKRRFLDQPGCPAVLDLQRPYDSPAFLPVGSQAASLVVAVANADLVGQVPVVNGKVNQGGCRVIDSLGCAVPAPTCLAFVDISEMRANGTIAFLADSRPGLVHAGIWGGRRDAGQCHDFNCDRLIVKAIPRHVLMRARPTARSALAARPDIRQGGVANLSAAHASARPRTISRLIWRKRFPSRSLHLGQRFTFRHGKFARTIAVTAKTLLGPASSAERRLPRSTARQAARFPRNPRLAGVGIQRLEPGAHHFSESLLIRDPWTICRRAHRASTTDPDAT